MQQKADWIVGPSRVYVGREVDRIHSPNIGVTECHYVWVKPRWAGVVLWWETTREWPVLQALLFAFAVFAYCELSFCR